MNLGSSFVVWLALCCCCHLATAARDLDRNSALIGYREVTSERIVLKTSYGEVKPCWTAVRLCNPPSRMAADALHTKLSIQLPLTKRRSSEMIEKQ